MRRNSDIMIINKKTGEYTEYASQSIISEGPVNVGQSVGRDVYFSSTNGPAEFINDKTDLGVNGVWNSQRNGYLRSSQQSGFKSMNFSFDKPVTGIGLYFNQIQDIDDVFFNLSIGYQEIIATSGIPISSGYVISLNIIDQELLPLKDNQGLFLALEFDKPDSLNFYSIAAFSPFVVDDLIFRNAVSTPEPATFVLFSSGFLVSFLLRKNRT